MPKIVHQETMCCGRQRCPEIKVFEDGSAELSDNDPEIGSIGTIKIQPEVAARIVELLKK